MEFLACTHHVTLVTLASAHLTHVLPSVGPGQPPEAEHGGVPPGHEAHQAPGLHLAPPDAGLGISPGLTGHNQRLALTGVIMLAWDTLAQLISPILI